MPDMHIGWGQVWSSFYVPSALRVGYDQEDLRAHYITLVECSTRSSVDERDALRHAASSTSMTGTYESTPSNCYYSISSDVISCITTSFDLRSITNGCLPSSHQLAYSRQHVSTSEENGPSRSDQCFALAVSGLPNGAMDRREQPSRRDDRACRRGHRGGGECTLGDWELCHSPARLYF